MGGINRRAFLASSAAALGAKKLFADGWVPVAGSLDTRIREYKNGNAYFASRLPDNSYVAEIVSARELGSPMATIDSFLYHTSKRFGRTPDIVVSGGNHDVAKSGIAVPDAFYMRNGKVQSDFRKPELYNGILYTDADGHLQIIGLQEFVLQIENLKPVDGQQVELLRYGRENLPSHNETATRNEPRHFISQGGGNTYSVVIGWVGLTNEWVKWNADSFSGEKIIALRGGHGAQARNWFREKSPEFGGNSREKSLVNAIAIYSRNNVR